jgi:hypothetical protein
MLYRVGKERKLARHFKDSPHRATVSLQVIVELLGMFTIRGRKDACDARFLNNNVDRLVRCHSAQSLGAARKNVAPATESDRRLSLGPANDFNLNTLVGGIVR